MKECELTTSNEAKEKLFVLVSWVTSRKKQWDSVHKIVYMLLWDYVHVLSITAEDTFKKRFVTQKYKYKPTHT